MPQVAVIIPAYNQSQFLSQAIQSVLDQTFSDWEAVIVDDGSSDDTRNVAHSFKDSRLRYIYQENRGLSAARNTGIRNSTAPYLSFLDSDDMFLPEKLALLLAMLQQHPELGLVAGQAVPVDENNQRVGKIMDTPLPPQPERLLLGNPLHVGSVLLRRNWQEQAGFFDESLRSYEDWDMWLRLGVQGCHMDYVNKPVSLYRFHTAQMTRIGTQMTTATFAVLDKLYSDPKLPAFWLELHDQAYSRAYLRAAAQAYHAKQYDYAKNCIQNAIQLNPSLTQDDGQPLSDTFSGWIDLPKTSRPLEFLETIYANLPESLQALQQRKRLNVGKAAIQLAFYSYQQGDMVMTRYAIRHAFRCQPRYLLNRGALAIFLRSLNA
jgi:glycosyltransferase involved in cell wall biosynthesis